MFTKSARLGGKDQNSRALFGSCASLPVCLSPGDHPLIYVAKLLLWNDAIIGDQVLVTVVYVVSVYLVSIRCHQSVSAETKKLGSELYYSNYKNQLYSKMASKQV